MRTTKPNKFIVLEGIDGAGKSTVSRLLADSIGATLIRTPQRGFSDARTLIDEEAELQSRFFFYLSTVLFASEKIKRLLKDSHVVCDRYIVSTLGYHKSLGLDLKFDLSSIELTKPDFTFFLRLDDEDERQRRIKGRNKFTKTDALIDDAIVRKKLVMEYLKFPMTQIDTCDSSADEVVAMIRATVGL